MKFASVADLIHPLSSKDFFSNVDNRHVLHVPGHCDRFKDLFGWTDLNRFLDQHLRHLQYPIVRLAREGKIIPPQRISDSLQTLRRGTFLRFSREKILREMADGATLIVNGIDDYANKLGELRQSLARELGERVQINVYFSPGGVGGFEPHYDTHDVLILQLEGSKHWRFFGESLVMPLEDQPSAGSSHPAEVTEGPELKPGDLLYIPRGQWHSALADNGPSLHLTIGIYHKTRIDLLAWLLEEAKSDMAMRENAASMGDEASLTASFAVVQRYCQTQLADPTGLARKFAAFSTRGSQAKEDEFTLPRI